MTAPRRLAALTLSAALAALGSAPVPDTEALLRQGTAAFERGDFAEAVTLFERAEPRATDPGLVAFNLASARYHLALAEGGSAAAFRECAALFRCCVGPGEPRRARALFGLGNCLLQSAGGSDVETLREAADCYQRCLRDRGADDRLRADARHNLQRARLLLAQSAADAPPDSSPSGDDKEPEPPPEEKNPGEPDGGEEAGAQGRPDPGATPMPAQLQPGEQPIPTDAPPAPGKGTIPPVPDSAEPSPLSPPDAVEHLRRAARRIREERQAYRKGRQRSAPPGVRDW
jgi:hypothetical protein